MLNLKIKKRFVKKNIPLKILHLVIMSNLTHLQGSNTKVIFMSRITEKIYVESETGSGSEINWKVGSGYGSEKIIPDP